MRPRGRAPFVRPRPDPGSHGAKLLDDLRLVKEGREGEFPGFDARRLVKVRLDQPLDLNSFASVKGVEIVSQEEKNLAILFSTQEALETFESRLTTYSKGGKVTRAEIFHALQSIDLVSEEDRVGQSLRKYGVPGAEEFSLDVELWPVEGERERRMMLEAFQSWLAASGMRSIDQVVHEALILMRVRTGQRTYKMLLNHRDVRCVELMPRFAIDLVLYGLPARDLPRATAPEEGAPRVCIVDSGINAGHPMLGAALGYSGSFIDGVDPEDRSNHGTPVAGIALHGDIEAALREGNLAARIWILSAKVLDASGQYEQRLIQSQVSEIVEQYVETYGCRIFNISLGDSNRPYQGNRLAALAVTLDTLARRHGVLFVVSAGNLTRSDVQELLRLGKSYPGYLLSDAPLIDPATALNVLTVGSIARYEEGNWARRYPNDVGIQPLARHNCASPFTRTGPSIKGAIKPDLVEYGGNFAVEIQTGRVVEHGLGEVSTRSDFLEAGLLGDFCGTSFAAPRLSNLAGRLQAELPAASHNLLRCILVAHAKPPIELAQGLGGLEEVLRVAGYGQADAEFLLRSDENVVTLYAEGALPNKRNHFYALPIPDEFTSGRMRTREITVAMAYSPVVRTTRVDYTATRLFFRLVRGSSLSYIVRMFDKQTAEEDFDRIDEVSPSGRSLGPQARERGTVQSSTWTMRRPQQGQYFVVVTRNDRGWAGSLQDAEEPYAICMVLRDRENVDARVYTRVQETLRQRVRVRP